MSRLSETDFFNANKFSAHSKCTASAILLYSFCYTASAITYLN